MPTARDFDQMLKCGLELKGLAQKVIDFSKMNSSSEVPEDAGEEDMVEIESKDSSEGEDIAKEDYASKMGQGKKGKGRMAALAIVLKKKMNNKKK